MRPRVTRVLTIIAGAIAAPEATALWDVRTAEDSGRTVTPWEQHPHSFPEVVAVHGNRGEVLYRCVRGREAR